MQIKKEKIKQTILEVAKQEFLEKGFKNASLREIAKKAEVTKGSIYIYFKNKDDLFSQLVAPAINFITKASDEASKKEHLLHSIRNPKKGSLQPLENSIAETREWCFNIMKEYNAFKLLLFKAAGSSKENYKEKIIQQYSKQSEYFYSKLGENRPEFKAKVSEMFIHTMAGTFVNMIEEIILHNPNDEELELYIEQVALFVHFGIEKMLLYQANR